MGDFVVLKYFLNRHDAGLAKGLLEEEGIESVIDADDCGGTRVGISFARIRLLVPANTVARAKEVVEVLEIEDE